MGGKWPNTATPEIQLIGAAVTELIPFNALAITDTNSHSTGVVDLSTFRGVQIIARSTLNQSVQLTLYPDGSAGAMAWNGSAWVTNPITLPSGSGAALLNTAWSFLDHPPFAGYNQSKLVILAQCTTAPTTGALTLYIEGEPIR